MNKLQVYNLCLERSNSLLSQGLQFFDEKQPEFYRSIGIYREEFASNSRYMHRGFYCPSPIRHLLVDNARRGKLLKRSTKRSVITHRFLFDKQNRLFLVERYHSNNRKNTEFLVYTNNAITGFTFDSFGSLVGLSEEIYENGLIQQYFIAGCLVHRSDNINLGITSISYERYYYTKDDKLNSADFYFSQFGLENLRTEEVNSLLFGGSYMFSESKTGKGIVLRRT